jgi:hypothetical protein
MSQDHYPGGNAAATALLSGAKQSEELARKVLETCRHSVVAELSVEEHYWVLATEDTMRVLLGEVKRAGSKFREALTELPTGNAGLAQASYDQVCRLYRACHTTTLIPCASLSRTSRNCESKSGKLGDCGGLFAQNLHACRSHVYQLRVSIQ